MSDHINSELHSFYEFLSSRIQEGQDSLSPEAALGLWRATMNDDVLAVQEALEDMRAGDRGVSLEEFDRRFRERHGLPESQ